MLYANENTAVTVMDPIKKSTAKILSIFLILVNICSPTSPYHILFLGEKYVSTSRFTSIYYLVFEKWQEVGTAPHPD
jgi:hypothetical protein